MSELQTNIKVADTEITGTLHYVTGYTGFHGSDPTQQEGNYLALKITAPEDATTTVEVVGGSKGPVALDEDMNIVLRIASTSQSIEVITTLKDLSLTKTYALTNLTLDPKPEM